MRGGREYLSAQLEKPVRMPQPKTAKINSPIYSSALGLMDLVFEITERREQESGLLDKLRRSFGKK